MYLFSGVSFTKKSQKERVCIECQTSISLGSPVILSSYGSGRRRRKVLFNAYHIKCFVRIRDRNVYNLYYTNIIDTVKRKLGEKVWMTEML